MDTTSTFYLELISIFEKHFSIIDDINQAEEPLTSNDLTEKLNQLLSFELEVADVNNLINHLNINRKKVGKDYYLLISAK